MCSLMGDWQGLVKRMLGSHMSGFLSSLFFFPLVNLQGTERQMVFGLIQSPPFLRYVTLYELSHVTSPNLFPPVNMQKTSVVLPPNAEWGREVKQRGCGN